MHRSLESCHHRIQFLTRLIQVDILQVGLDREEAVVDVVGLLMCGLDACIISRM